MSLSEKIETDLQSHHIEGMLHDGRHMRVPLISEILPNLWVGGCKNGVCLPVDFRFVLSLYPWEKYALGPDTGRMEVRLYDSAEIPRPQQLYELAALVNAERERGKTLVHCQAGLNRSNLVTALALILDGRTPVDAIGLLRARRSPLVLCNKAFEGWLLTQAAQTERRAA